ncbi:MAG: putative selenium-dependent hydroxylase accessory protein YqeC [Armatimonadetes bacterium]|nr:putative selenium-dependent hydroxylase accessory protein YqeC [Armatimonadota bacterium]
MNLLEAFELHRKDAIAFIGGGGKASLMLRICQEASAERWKVLLTTTTHMWPKGSHGNFPALLEVRDEKELRQVEQAFLTHGALTVVGNASAIHRMEAPPLPIVERLPAIEALDLLLIKADGARDRSLKGHRSYEPVVPACTTVSVAVVGMDVIGKPLEARHVHHPELVSEWLTVPKGALITEKMVADVILHPKGYLARLRGRVIVFLNKVNSPESARSAGSVAHILVESKRVNRVVLGDTWARGRDEIIKDICLQE